MGPPPEDRRGSDGGTARSAGRERLSRERIVTTTIDLIEDSGLRAFTMAAVAERLSVQTMALYPYTGSREQLLDAVVAAVLVEVLPGDEVEHDPDWESFLRRSAHGIRHMALTHPQIFPLVATRPPEAPWVRPPLRSLDWMESFIATLRGFGFSAEATVAVYRSFASFLLGHLLLEVVGLGVDAAPVEPGEAPEPEAAQDLTGYPTLADMEAPMREDRSQPVFDAALADLIARVEAFGTTAVIDAQ
ncbi:TetR/AcrR family transcriptional regulator C-terminal domain-containing protein [Nakamurella flavida]|uniref:TetR/AcrR family transcriptional regulator C-terminal domain-containing protein n=1 Tax=Nakamurella flavida TaxID=363630 RepID=A0A938YMW7_9ACTN|nr:TetR/AcrR family transcriptional regulator C-terminal domain-containing protein [Nakamurella flavida]MBM9477633.1 TetR/AcrR family transcriptional regulator C-terminal domain-containing protein [Nakamurella flavida]MDP9779183.1 AcrR family transcriptional regulator [Nakamurella flavida]